MRSGYGVEFSRDEEMRSSRLVRTDRKHRKGMCDGEARMARKIVMEGIEVALREMRGMVRKDVLAHGA
jgi:hypothetical protein